jgi:catechol 2,3-dioxygenase-like lactoylglutathione lyase family enzyme
VSGGVGQLSGVALECRDPAALADFYSRLTEWPVVHANADWYSVGESENAGFHLSFQRSPGHQPPTWPDPASSMQLHLHFRVDDLDAAERAVLALGETMFDDQPGDRSRVYADPAGNRSAMSRPEIAPSSSRSGRPRHDRWPCRRPVADSQPPMRGTETVVRRISRSHRAGSLDRSTRREVR